MSSARERDDAIARATAALMDPRVREMARQTVANQIEKLDASPEARDRARLAFKEAVACLDREERAAEAAEGRVEGP